MAGFDGVAEELLESVKTHAEAILDRCGDRYSSKGTPMLVDGMDLDTGEPERWDGHVLTNPARQQNLARTLEGLTALTGEGRYRDRAEEWLGHALRVLRDPASGMLYWGGHTSYDLEADAPLIGNHELKCSYPYYELLYCIDADVTRDLVEGIWHRHINDWQNLLFNRHGEYENWDRASRWGQTYEGSPLPIIENTSLSFINTGSDLVHAASLISTLTGATEPLVWAKRLLGRYDEIRHPDTGLGGYQFNHRDPCRVRESFRSPLGDREDVNEVTVLSSGLIQTRYGRAAITWMNLYEALGPERGQEFIDMVSKDLTALAKHSYDEDEHVFHPVVVDGTRLSPEDAVEGVGYCRPNKLHPVKAEGWMFLSYARAYRITGCALLGEMARSLAEGMGWTGEGGPLDGEGTMTPSSWDVPNTPSQAEAGAVMGLLELGRATGEDRYLAAAGSLGLRLAQDRATQGILKTGTGTTGRSTGIDNALPLALLHVVGALTGSEAPLPRLHANNAAFDPKVIIARRERAS